MADTMRDAKPREASFRTGEIASVMLISVIASYVGALQPILLSALADERRLSLSEIGQTAMFEALGMAVAVAAAGIFLKPHRIRAIVLISLALSLAANSLTIIGSHAVILLARLATGLSAGVLLWVWTGLLARSLLPARLVGIFMTLQATGALLLSSLFAHLVLPRFGASGAYACLAAGSLLSVALSWWVPQQYTSVSEERDNGLRLPPPLGVVGLLAVAIHQAGIMAFWVYVLPIGRERGFSDPVIAFVISIALAFQILGGLSGAAMARMSANLALYASIAASLLGLALFGLGSGSIAAGAGVVIVAFFWMYAPGYQMPYLLQVDPTKRSAMQMITAQLLGLSCGPALASLTVYNDQASGALVASAALFIIAAALIFATTAFRSKATQEVPSF